MFINDDYPRGHRYVIHGILDFACGDAMWVTRVAAAVIGRQATRYCLTKGRQFGMTRKTGIYKKHKVVA